jgi:hypothetical protein
MRLVTSVVASSLALLLASSAFAQSEEAKAQAQRRYEEGLAFHNKDQEEEAYTRFAQAYAVLQSPPILFNLARTEQLTGRFADAAGHFKDYLAHPDHPRITADLRQKARAFLADIQLKLGHVTVDAPTGTIISVDGVAATSGTLDVKPGTHAVVGQLGPETRTVTVSCVAGQVVTAKIAFDSPVPVVVAPIAPVAPVTPSPEPVQPTPRSSGSGAKLGVVIATAAVGAIGIGVGVGFEAAASSKGSDVSAFQGTNGSSSCFGSTASRCQQLSGAAGSDTSDHNVGTGMLIGGGIFLAASVVTFLAWPNSKEPPASGYLVPILSPTTGGLGYAGRF